MRFSNVHIGVRDWDKGPERIYLKVRFLLDPG